jgi:hypothetical protein
MKAPKQINADQATNQKPSKAKYKALKMQTAHSQNAQPNLPQELQSTNENINLMN